MFQYQSIKSRLHLLYSQTISTISTISILIFISFGLCSVAWSVEPKIKPVFALRSFYMNTQQEGQLIDSQALAYGGQLGALLELNESFSVKAVSYLTQRASFLDQPTALDPQLNKPIRYESTLVDSLHPKSQELALLGEVFLAYQNPKLLVQIGRMLAKSALVNPQDGRMLPTFVEGAFSQWKFSDRIQLSLAIYHRIAPRNTNGFFDVGGSIGLYPQGVNALGKPNQNLAHLSAQALIIGGFDWQILKNLQYQAQFYQITGLQNTYFQELQSHLPKDRFLFSIGVMHLFQQGISSKDTWWITQNHRSQVMSAYLGFRINPMKNFRINHQFRQADTSDFLFEIAFTKILDQDAFLFPREWGIEPFYTFLRRERSEGMADLQASMMAIGTSLSAIVERFSSLSQESILRSIQWRLAAAYLKTPSLQDFAINKYGLDDYLQSNFEIKYQADHLLKNLSFEGLFVYKKALSDDITDLQRFNKLNLYQINFWMNYRF
jgi:hypothetical protein